MATEQSDEIIDELQEGMPQAPPVADHDSSVLDLAFAIDVTASMGPYIEQAQMHIRHIVEEIVAAEKSDVRLALVEYRDHPPQCNSFVTRTNDFTDSIKTMKKWLDMSSPHGGGDEPEALADALHDVMKLDWRPEATKICVLITDAPPHGLIRTYGIDGFPDGTFGMDGFPDGCPLGLDPVSIVNIMAKKNITLYSVGCETSVVSIYPYRDFFMALSYITGGQYVPLRNANLLSKIIIGGAQEEITLHRLMADVRTEMFAEGALFGAGGAVIDVEEKAVIDEEEISLKIYKKLREKGVRTKSVFGSGAPEKASELAMKMTSKGRTLKEWREEWEKSPASKINRQRGFSLKSYPSAPWPGIFGRPNFNIGTPTITTATVLPGGFGIPIAASVTSGGFGIPITASVTSGGFGIPITASVVTFGGFSIPITANVTFGGFSIPVTANVTFGRFSIQTTASVASGGFGIPTTASVTSSGFGIQTTASVTSSGFGIQTTASVASGGFGIPISASVPFGGFGIPTTASVTSGGFGIPTTASVTSSRFGIQTTASVASGGFGIPITASATCGGFCFPIKASTTSGGFGIPIRSGVPFGGFGIPTTASAASSGFGSPTTASATSGGFGIPTTASATSGGFGFPTTTSVTSSGFGIPTTASVTSSGFGIPTTASATSSGFGIPTTASATSGGFGIPTTASVTSGGFGIPTTTSVTSSGFTFGLSSGGLDIPLNSDAPLMYRSVLTNAASSVAGENLKFGISITPETMDGPFGPSTLGKTLDGTDRASVTTDNSNKPGGLVESATTSFTTNSPAQPGQASSLFGGSVTSTTASSSFGGNPACFGAPVSHDNNMSGTNLISASAPPGALFGSSTTSATAPSGFSFGTPTSSACTGMTISGASNSTPFGGFGFSNSYCSTAAPSSTFGFSASSASSGGSLFGASGGATSTTVSLDTSTVSSSTPFVSSGFSNSSTAAPSSALGPSATSVPSCGSLFGAPGGATSTFAYAAPSTEVNSTPFGGFGFSNSSSSTAAPSNTFGFSGTSLPSGGGLFGAPSGAAATFGNHFGFSSGSAFGGSVKEESESGAMEDDISIVESDLTLEQVKRMVKKALASSKD